SAIAEGWHHQGDRRRRPAGGGPHLGMLGRLVACSRLVQSKILRRDEEGQACLPVFRTVEVAGRRGKIEGHLEAVVRRRERGRGRRPPDPSQGALGSLRALFPGFRVKFRKLRNNPRSARKTTLS